MGERDILIGCTQYTNHDGGEIQQKIRVVGEIQQTNHRGWRNRLQESWWWRNTIKKGCRRNKQHGECDRACTCSSNRNTYRNTNTNTHTNINTDTNTNESKEQGDGMHRTVNQIQIEWKYKC